MAGTDPIDEKLLTAVLGISEIGNLTPPSTSLNDVRGALVNDDEIRTHGFPASTAESFRNTAESMNAVVSSRVPGGATTDLIESGHDLKSYFVKSKSCNWGPFSGFLCVNPAFNKKGASGIDHNRNSYRKYVLHLSSSNADPGKIEGDPDIAAEDSVPTSLKLPPLQRPFVQIHVSEARLNSGEGTSYILEALEDGYFGIGWDHTKTVAMEFFAKRTEISGETFYALSYGNTWVKTDDEFTPYTNPFRDHEIGPDRAGRAPDDHHDWPDGIADRLPDWVKDATRDRTPIGFLPINGIINPFPPYTRPEQRFLNAVTGDYDLFAVWPKAKDEEELTRVTEINYGWKNLFEVGPYGKPLALRSSVNRNLVLEFIPNYEEITPLESNQVGNINPAVMLAAGILNSFECKQPRTADGELDREEEPISPTPNRAFHSDEGGRPGIKEIEYPIAFFLPKNTANQIGLEPESLPQLAITKPEQFLALICLLVRSHAIPLNFGWWIDLCKTIGEAGDEEASLKTYMDFLLNGRSNSPGKDGSPAEGLLGVDPDGILRKVQASFLELLTEPHWKSDSSAKMENILKAANLHQVAGEADE